MLINKDTTLGNGITPSWWSLREYLLAAVPVFSFMIISLSHLPPYYVIFVFFHIFFFFVLIFWLYLSALIVFSLPFFLAHTWNSLSLCCHPQNTHHPPCHRGKPPLPWRFHLSWTCSSLPSDHLSPTTSPLLWETSWGFTYSSSPKSCWNPYTCPHCPSPSWIWNACLNAPSWNHLPYFLMHLFIFLTSRTWWIPCMFGPSHHAPTSSLLWYKDLTSFSLSFTFLLYHLIHHSHSPFLSCSPQMITSTWYSSQLPLYLFFSLSLFLSMDVPLLKWWLITSSPLYFIPSHSTTFHHIPLTWSVHIPS